MTIYSFNLGIGWASSGVEYAQLYRAQIFRNLKQKAKFIFLDLITGDNIEHLTHNIGFTDDEIIWIYQYFSDIKIEPTSYSLKQLENSFSLPFDRIEQDTGCVRYIFDKANVMVTAYFAKKNKDVVERAEYVSRGKLIRKDYYTHAKLFSEYYTPRDNRAYVYERRFFNQDGSISLEEIVDGESSMFRLKNQVIQGKNGLIAYLLKSLNLTKTDIIILDRATNIGSTIFKYSAPAKLGVVVHAEHFNDNQTDEQNVLWNNFYEYQFDQVKNVDFLITATHSQEEVLSGHFDQYTAYTPNIVTIPVGNLDKLHVPLKARKTHSLITASRLANEKHVDWLVSAVIKAKEVVPDITFDIYGKGGEEQKIRKIINDNHAQDYIKLMGHSELTQVYQKYDAYISASTSEGFGVTLMEAVGSGLPIIGFDVRYGNQTFIQNKKNGYLITYDKSDDISIIISKLTHDIIVLYTEHHLADFEQQSYNIAKDYLVDEVQQKWQNLIERVLND